MSPYHNGTDMATSYKITIHHQGGSTTVEFADAADQVRAYTCMSQGASGIFRHLKGEGQLLLNGTLLMSEGALSPVLREDDGERPVEAVPLAHTSSSPVKTPPRGAASPVR
jgi:hypothetical protein